jgi:uncharacterized ubiquitin-like protein YukD
MKLTVRTLKQETFEIDVEDTGTVNDAKQAVAEARDVPHDWIKMIFNGQIMENDKSLSEYNVKDGCGLVILTKKPKEAEPVPVEVQQAEVQQAEVQQAEVQQAEVQQAEVQQAEEQCNEGDDGEGDVGEEQAEQPVVSNEPFNMFDAGLAQAQAGAQAGAQLLPNVNNPEEMLQSFQQQLQQNPQLFMQMLMQNPMIAQFSQQNPEEFQQVINDPNFLSNVMNASQDMYNEEEPIKIELTDDEKKDIDDLVGMGFNKLDAIQYYRACGNNKEAAASMLMEDQFDQD